MCLVVFEIEGELLQYCKVQLKFSDHAPIMLNIEDTTHSFSNHIKIPKTVLLDD